MKSSQPVNVNKYKHLWTDIFYEQIILRQHRFTEEIYKV